MEIDPSSATFICLSCEHKFHVTEVHPKHRQIARKDFDINFDDITANKFRDDDTTFTDEYSICGKCKQNHRYISAGGNSRVTKICGCKD